MSFLSAAMDPATAALIVRLSLEDIEEVNATQRGKARFNTPPDDVQIALQAQTECLNAFLKGQEDFEFAKSLDRALATDFVLVSALSVVALGERDDHEAALALSRGLPLPPQTDRQRALQRRPPEAPNPIHPPNRDERRSIDKEGAKSHATPASTSSLSPNRPSASRPLKRPFVNCTICFNPCTFSYIAPCNHHYCLDCLRELVEAATRDESLYPLKCCRQEFPQHRILPYLKGRPALLTLFEAKSLEFGTPSNLRIYCPTPTCSRFLGSSTAGSSAVVCDGCSTAVCMSCKNVQHTGEPCGVATSTLQLRTLAKANSWQTCPGCQSIVELQMGCFHITCRCKTEFCYLCAVPWKKCECRQWDENRLVDAAEQRVINEFGRAAPALHARRVEERANRLRVDHFCRHSSLMYRHGDGVCEHCGHYLARFLLMCRDCSTLACVRCSRNRL